MQIQPSYHDLSIENITDLDQQLVSAAMLTPDKIALADSYKQLTWRELDQRLNQVANALITIGIEPDQRIALLGRNSVEYALLFLGGLRAGICITPLSPLASEKTLVDMINDSASKLLFVSSEYWKVMMPFSNRLTHLLDQGLKKLDHLWKFIAGARSDAIDISYSMEWGFNLIYSSGTTGVPKGILQSRCYRATENKYLADLNVRASSRGLFSTPLYSNTTLFLFFGVLSAGGTAYLMEKFSTKRFLELSENHENTQTVLEPVQYERLLKEPLLETSNLTSYELKLSTSAPLHKPVKEEILKRWPEGGLVEIYGMTEGGIFCNLIAHEQTDKLDTVGRPAPSCDLRIIDENGNVQPQGDTGEVIGRSNRMMDGYHNRPEATEEASWYDSDGRRYQKSGDIGWLDDDGFLHLLGRKKDVIISGGFNIYAIDLERTLLSHPEVTDAAVIAAPSEQWGETPVAFVVVVNKSEANGETLRQWTNSQLGKAQRISELKIIDKLPRSPIGKVLKRELLDGLVGAGN